MRSFTRIFKHLLGLGFDPEGFITSTWGTVKTAALAHTPTPQLRESVNFIDKLVATVAGLPKPKPGDDDEDEPAKPKDAAPQTTPGLELTPT